jgi:hypothetical protein
MKFSGTALALLAMATPMPVFGWVVAFSSDTSCKSEIWDESGKGTQGCKNMKSTTPLYSWSFLPEGEKVYAIAYSGENCSGGDTGPIHKQCLNSDMYTFGAVKSYKVRSARYP